MPPEQRRAAIIEATLPLLRLHGRMVTTRQIADAAGIAEGTVFRVFDSKDELIDAAVAYAFQPGQVTVLLAQIDPALGLRDRLVEVTRIMQERFVSSFGLIRALGLLGPPANVNDDEEGRRIWRAEILGAIVELIGPDAASLRVPPAEAVRILRLLTFAGSHAEVADGNLMSPEEIVDTLLHGLLTPPSRKDS